MLTDGRQTVCIYLASLDRCDKFIKTLRNNESLATVFYTIQSLKVTSNPVPEQTLVKVATELNREIEMSKS